MIYGRPVIKLTDTLDVFFGQLFSKKLILPDDIDWRTHKLKKFIDTHPSKTHSNLDDICNQLGLPMSGRQARRLFKTSTGIGIRHYSMNIRLSVAAEQLRLTDMPIKVVAAEAGYQNSRHFARRFKEVFHVKPMEFRKVWRRREFASEPGG